MSKRFGLLMVLVLVVGLFGGLLTTNTVSADPMPGQVIEIPRLDVGNVFGTGTWHTRIQVQNVGIQATWAAIVYWGGDYEPCPPNATGDIGWQYQWIPVNGIWTVTPLSGAESAIVWSLGANVPAVKPQPGDPGTGSDLAVTVDRHGPDSYGDFDISSSYTGVSDPWMTGGGYSFKYFAPYVMVGYNGELDTTITIQNSGRYCTSVWIYYKQEDNCEFMKAQHIEQIAPGESIRIGSGVDADVGYPSPELNAPWLGSAYITANEEMAIIIDQLSHGASGSTNQGTLLTHRAMPYTRYGEVEVWDTAWYADLLYREISGWQSSIQVQNHTQTSVSTFVTVEFFDQSGDSIYWLGDWVCRNGSATFFLPAITDLGVNLPFGYIGAAEIGSHGQIGFPGSPYGGEPISAVVDIKKVMMYDAALPGWRATNPGETQGGSYNAHPLHQKERVDKIALPYIAKEYNGVTSRIVIRNNSNCNKIKGNIYIKDETGRNTAYIPVGWLHPKHMALRDLNATGVIPSGFVGAATFEIEDVEQFCDTDFDGEVDQAPYMPSAVVVNYGWEYELEERSARLLGPLTTEGDLCRIYEGIPFGYADVPCQITISGRVIDAETLKPIAGATFELEGQPVAGETTDSTGWYSFPYSKTMEKQTLDLKASAANYNPVTLTHTDVECNDQVFNFALAATCQYVTVRGTVEDKETGNWIQGATVTATNSEGAATDTTDANGVYEITTLPFDANNVNIVSVAATGYNSAYDSVYIPACGGTARISFQLHQTPMKRILLYWGNGAQAAAGTDYDSAEAVFKYFGYQVDYQSRWPGGPDLEEYKVIFLLGPGNANGDPASNNFTPGQISQLDLFLRHGGRLVVMTEAGAAVSVENNLLSALNLQLAFNAATIAGALASNITADQLTTGVGTLNLDTATSIGTATGVPGVLAALSTGQDMVAADTLPGVTRAGDSNWTTLGFAGDVVIIGDLDWMDDASFMGTITYSQGEPDYVWPNWPADNENLLLNIFNF